MKYDAFLIFITQSVTCVMPVASTGGASRGRGIRTHDSGIKSPGFLP